MQLKKLQTQFRFLCFLFVDILNFKLTILSSAIISVVIFDMFPSARSFMDVVCFFSYFCSFEHGHLLQ